MATQDDAHMRPKKMDQVTRERNAWEALVAEANAFATALESNATLAKAHGEKLMKALVAYKEIHALRSKP